MLSEKYLDNFSIFSLFIVILLKYNFNNYSLALVSGNINSICLSNLPGHIKASSKVSGQLVAANTTTA